MKRRDSIAPGEVWLVGAGPGDPDLLTLKAARLIEEAEVVFHDALVGAGILDLINDLLVEAARRGKRVVRLKGGDPSIFGRSGEEVGQLERAGIRVHICPGITAASAAAAGALVPLTLRGAAQSVTFLTACSCEEAAADHDWDALAANGGTIAIYMGRAAAGHVSRSLIAAGLAPTTPALIAVSVSLPEERIVRTQLCAMPMIVSTFTDQDPTLLLIGRAVADAEDFSGAVRDFANRSTLRHPEHSIALPPLQAR
jgi:uroporphyrin-III C-methyltransferase